MYDILFEIRYILFYMCRPYLFHDITSGDEDSNVKHNKHLLSQLNFISIKKHGGLAIGMLPFLAEKCVLARVCYSLAQCYCKIKENEEDEEDAARFYMKVFTGSME